MREVMTFILSEVVFTVFLALLLLCNGCARHQSPPQDGLVVKYLPYRLCNTPAIVYVEPGVPEWQAKALWAGAQYWNDDTGLELFSWGGVLQTLDTVSVTYNDRGEMIPIVLAGFAEQSELQRVVGTDWLWLEGYMQPTSIVKGCLQTARVMIRHELSLLMVQAEQFAMHEFGHVLGLAHAQYGTLMEHEIDLVKETPTPSILPDHEFDKTWIRRWERRFVITANSDELGAIVDMYGGGEKRE
jgi:hypothetical protein